MHVYVLANADKTAGSVLNSLCVRKLEGEKSLDPRTERITFMACVRELLPVSRLYESMRQKSSRLRLA